MFITLIGLKTLIINFEPLTRNSSLLLVWLNKSYHLNKIEEDKFKFELYSKNLVAKSLRLINLFYKHSKVQPSIKKNLNSCMFQRYLFDSLE